MYYCIMCSLPIVRFKIPELKGKQYSKTFDAYRQNALQKGWNILYFYWLHMRINFHAPKPKHVFFPILPNLIYKNKFCLILHFFDNWSRLKKNTTLKILWLLWLILLLSTINQKIYLQKINAGPLLFITFSKIVNDDIMLKIVNQMLKFLFERNTTFAQVFHVIL